MATLTENAAAVRAAQVAIDAAIVAKGGSTAGGLINAAAAIATIPSGGGGGPSVSVSVSCAYGGKCCMSYRDSASGEHELIMNGSSASTPPADCSVQRLSDVSAVRFHDFIYTEGFYKKINGVEQPFDTWISVSDGDAIAMFADNSCIVSGALVTMANGTLKLIDNVTYGDLLRVWDFDNGRWAEARPIWVKRTETASSFWTDTFSDGRILKTVGPYGHRLLNIEKGRWEYDTNCVGKRVMTADGEATLLSCKKTFGEVEFYNVITERHFNVVCNGVLTSSSRNNLYPIRDMRFVKEHRAVRQMSDFVFPNAVSERFYAGCRLFETADSADYVNRFVAQKAAHDSIQEVANGRA